MYHSITFQDNKGNVRNTWDDWHLIPSSRPVINIPPLRSKTVEIPGASGTVDLTEILSGEPLYGDRTGSVDFYVMQDWYSSESGRIEKWDWTTAFSTVATFIHGRQMRVVLEDDPDYYYYGRITMNSWKTNKDYSQITLDYVLYPYKYENTSTAENWLWDPFSFETGIINEYPENILNANGEIDLSLLSGSGAGGVGLGIIGGSFRGMIDVSTTKDVYIHIDYYGSESYPISTSDMVRVNKTHEIGEPNVYTTVLGAFIQNGSNIVRFSNVDGVEYTENDSAMVAYRRAEF